VGGVYTLPLKWSSSDCHAAKSLRTALVPMVSLRISVGTAEGLPPEGSVPAV